MKLSRSAVAVNVHWVVMRARGSLQVITPRWLFVIAQGHAEGDNRSKKVSKLIQPTLRTS